MPDAELIITAKNHLSEPVKTMAQDVKSFDKDIEEMQRRLEELKSKKIDMKVDMTAATKQVKEAEKAFKSLNDESSELSFKNAMRHSEDLKTEYKSLTKEIDQLEKEMRGLGSAESSLKSITSEVAAQKKELSAARSEMLEIQRASQKAQEELERTQSKLNNQASGGSLEKTLTALGQAGAYSMVGEVAAQAAQAYASSLLGNVGGSLFGSALSYAGQGAAIGSMIAPGIGTAVGAAAGAGLGLISGGIGVAQSQDERFKSYVQSTYEGIQAERQTQLMTGSGIAAGRETAQQSFATLFKDAAVAEQFLSKMVDFANDTPFLFDDLTSMAKVLSTYGYQVSELQQAMQDIGDAGAALGMGQEDMGMVATGLGRMRSSGKASLEYINLLQERGIDAIGYLAEARGTDNAQVYADISKSLIDGAEAAKIIQEAMRADFAGSMQKQSETFSGLQSTLEGMQDEMANAMGAGYNETRKQGMQEQISFLSGAAAEQMQEAYKYIGQFQADLENKKEEYLRDAMTAVMEGTMGENFKGEIKEKLQELHEEYQQAIEAAEGGDKEAQAKLGGILAEAQADAIMAYNEDEGEKLRIKSEIEVIQSIQKDADVTKAYNDAGYQLGLKFNEGLMKARLEDVSYETVMMDNGAVMTYQVPSRAMGETRVPRDGMYMLHEGEKVLTASQARAYDSSGGIEPLTDLGGMMEMGMPFEMERTTTTTVTDWPAPTPGTAQGAGGSAGTGGVTVTITGNEFVVRNERDIDAIAQAFVQKIQAAAMVT